MPGSIERRVEAAWRRRGPLAVLLLPLALLYRAAVAVRRTLYAAGMLRAERLPVPVLVVGNLIAGGAGKTPTVIALVGWLRARGWTPGIVSRGHGGSATGPLEVGSDTPAAECGDEPLLLRLRTGAPLVVGRDRVAAGRELLRLAPQVDIVVSDDGLQHLRLARDAQVIVFDERGAGNGWPLPAGPLREPLPARVPPRSVVLYNAPRPSTRLEGGVAARRLAGVAPLAGWWAGEAATPEALAALRGRPVLAAAGVARPQRFFDMLRDAGLAVAPLPLPDHHAYGTLPWPADTADVVVTEKDAVKLRRWAAVPAAVVPAAATAAAAAAAGALSPAPPATRIWVATLDFRPGDDTLERLAALLPAAPRPPPAKTT